MIVFAFGWIVQRRASLHMCARPAPSRPIPSTQLVSACALPGGLPAFIRFSWRASCRRHPAKAAATAAGAATGAALMRSPGQGSAQTVCCGRRQRSRYDYMPEPSCASYPWSASYHTMGFALRWYTLFCGGLFAEAICFPLCVALASCVSFCFLKIRAP